MMGTPEDVAAEIYFTPPEMPASAQLTPDEIAEHYHNEDGLYVYAKEVADHASEKAYEQGYKDRDAGIAKEKAEFGASVGDAMWESGYEQGKRDERERILKLYEDMGCVPEEESCWYSFWQAIGGDSIPESLKETI